MIIFIEEIFYRGGEVDERYNYRGLDAHVDNKWMPKGGFRPDGGEKYGQRG
jgi:hypothetical protein